MNQEAQQQAPQRGGALAVKAPSRAEQDAALQTLGINRASAALAATLGIEPKAMIEVIKAQCFKGTNGNVSDEQLAALCSVASNLGLNPLVPGMMYAYPDGKGIMPMIGPDGVFKLLSSHPNVKSWDVKIDSFSPDGKPFSATANIFMADGTIRSKTVYYSEWFIDSNVNWKKRPCHMLEIRALKQDARQVIHGLPWDEEERAMSMATTVTAEVIKPSVDVPPANRAIGHRQAAEAKTRQEAPNAASEPVGDPAGPSGDSGEPQDGEGDGTLFGDSNDPGANESREVPLDGAEAAKAGGFSQHDNPHVGGEARKKWLADFNREAGK